MKLANDLSNFLYSNRASWVLYPALLTMNKILFINAWSFGVRKRLLNPFASSINLVCWTCFLNSALAWLVLIPFPHRCSKRQLIDNKELIMTFTGPSCSHVRYYGQVDILVIQVGIKLISWWFVEECYSSERTRYCWICCRLILYWIWHNVLKWFDEQGFWWKIVHELLCRL